MRQEAGPGFFGGVHQELVGAIQGFHGVADAFCTGGGVAPEDLHEDVWLGTERFTAGRHSHLLVQHWLPHRLARCVGAPTAAVSDRLLVPGLALAVAAVVTTIWNFEPLRLRS